MKKKEKIDEYIQNNELNIEEIVQDYSNYVQTIIRNKIVFTKEDTEEIISDVFVTLWKNQNKLDGNKKLSSYLAGITKNLIKKKYRGLKQEDNIEDYEEKLILAENIILYSEIDEKNEIILNEINKMKEEDQKIFLMYYYENKKIKLISHELTISESKVKMKLSRMRKKLVKLINERGMELK